MSIKAFVAVRSLSAALLAVAVSSTGAFADGKAILVALDRAKIVKVPPGVQTMIIGNPLVADVTMLKGNTSMIVTGRSFGSTNLISLDAAGNPIDESLIKVTASEQSVVVLRGTARNPIPAIRAARRRSRSATIRSS